MCHTRRPLSPSSALLRFVFICSFSAVTQTPLLTAALPGLLPAVGGTPTSAAVAAVTHAALRQTLASASAAAAAASSSPVKRQRTDSAGAGQFGVTSGIQVGGAGPGSGGGNRKKQGGGGGGGAGGGGAAGGCGANVLNGIKNVPAKTTSSLHIQPIAGKTMLTVFVHDC